MIQATLNLADGRALSYSQWGPPDATPVFYFHGFPTSRHELELARPRLEQSNLPIRVIAIDRPGFGTSTAKPNRTLLDWPTDVAEAADLLDIDRFAVLGVSAGGPYALACGRALPDRVTRVGVVVGIAPMSAAGMDKAAIAQMPKNRWFRRGQFTMVAFAFSRGQEDKIVAQAMATMGEADQRALEQAATRNSFIEMTRGAFTQGGSAATHEAVLYLQPWGFNPAHITVPTDLWYGGADELVPATAGQWLADRIPRSSYTLWPQHGHITWCDSDEAIDVFTAVTANAPPGEQP